MKSGQPLAMSQGDQPLNAERAARRLGTQPGLSAEALQTAFRVAVKQAHPDRPGGDDQSLRAVIEAYHFLKSAQAELQVAAPDGDHRPAPPPILQISPVEALCGGRHRTRTLDGREVYVSLPAGLRAGDAVRVAGVLCSVTIVSQDGLAVIGDHLCQTAVVDPAVLRKGGNIRIRYPLGSVSLRINRLDAERGLARLVGRGLPARGDRPRGDLLLRLEAAEPSAPPQPSEAQTKLRRFTADWAA